MSRRAELEQRLERLAEISDILTAMKTMALIETRKFGRFLDHQGRLLAGIEAAAADFLAFHPTFRGQQPPVDGDRHVLLLIGSERGFCGDFNQALAVALDAFPEPKPRLLVVGRRLAGKLVGHPRWLEGLSGPSVAEEIPAVLDAVMESLRRWQAQPPGWVRLSALAHRPDGPVASHGLLPLAPPPAPGFAYPPQLQLEPSEFFAGLVDHYLSAQLPGLFYGSLLAENRARLEHMERALARLRDKSDELQRHRNALRQEDITEEIEVILLSAESLPADDE
ncbi:F0F1 ATP synthase subunit gamma [Candidatus Methylocalor cossyra]|uniref:ATP synthase gamma chain n=1 Tax=Candidatus Methylocalor cossyra TaxID=3108543 RepID=A0ABM9NGL3_9GAMM